jgi:hypothetical protein
VSHALVIFEKKIKVLITISKRMMKSDDVVSENCELFHLARKFA